MGPVETFKDDIGFGRFADGHHFDIDLVDFYNPWKRTFTNFTFKFCKIVRSCNVIDFLLHFTVYPLPETADVNLS